MTEKVELKPCPFCGGVPDGIRSVGDESGEGYLAIECENCFGSNNKPFCGVHGDDEAEVVAAWNERKGEK